MNVQPEMIPDNIPPGIYENIIQPMIKKKESARTQTTDNGILMDLMKRLESLETKIAGIVDNNKVPEVPPDMNITGSTGLKGKPAEGNMNLPPFIQQKFQDDFKQKPAESIVNLMSEIYSKKPGIFKDGGKSMADMMGLFQNISKQARKDRLIEKYQDAGEMINDIEQIFKDVPEIKNRADAYEIAYKLVRGTLMEKDGEHQLLNTSQHGKKTKEKDTDDFEALRKEKKRAFVEGKKTSLSDRNETELSDMEKMICRKLGISEEKFKKYRRK